MQGPEGRDNGAHTRAEERDNQVRACQVGIICLVFLMHSFSTVCFLPNRLNRSNVHGTGSSGSGSSGGSYSYYRKEKALKIYTGEEDEDEEHRSRDSGN